LIIFNVLGYGMLTVAWVAVIAVVGSHDNPLTASHAVPRDVPA
jgi:hypothetical protein